MPVKQMLVTMSQKTMLANDFLRAMLVSGADPSEPSKLAGLAYQLADKFWALGISRGEIEVRETKESTSSE